MRTIDCDRSFSSQILEIFNDAILNSTALYDYKPRTMEMMDTWFDAKEKGRFPVIGVVADDGELMGFGSYGVFRAFPAYKYSVEHSVYVQKAFRGQGVGKLLLNEIIRQARAQNYHVLIGAIDSRNATSIGLHAGLGFQHSGRVREVGFKFGKWLDVDFYQLILESPLTPMDG